MSYYLNVPLTDLVNYNAFGTGDVTSTLNDSWRSITYLFDREAWWFLVKECHDQLLIGGQWSLVGTSGAGAAGVAGGA